MADSQAVELWIEVRLFSSGCAHGGARVSADASCRHQLKTENRCYDIRTTIVEQTKQNNVRTVVLLALVPFALIYIEKI